MNVTEDQIRASLAALTERKRAYMIAFGDGPASGSVLADLAKFCRAESSCWDPDPRLHAVLEGRREVWLRIQQHLNKTPEELLEIALRDHVRVVKVEKDEDNA